MYKFSILGTLRFLVEKLYVRGCELTVVKYVPAFEIESYAGASVKATLIFFQAHVSIFRKALIKSTIVRLNKITGARKF